MKKFILAVVAVVVIVAAVFIAAPVLAGAALVQALLFKGVNLVAITAGIPTWAAVLVFIALIPSALWWCFQVFKPQLRRRVAGGLIAAAFIYVLVTAALANQRLVAAVQNAAATVHRLLVPVKPADPALESWFYPDGRPRLYFARTGTNRLAFYQGARPGDADPVAGVRLEPVSRDLRMEFDAAQTRERDAEQARAENAERLALEAQRQSALTDLLQQQQKITRTLSKMTDLPLQSVRDAAQTLAVARAMLVGAMTNKSADLAAVQAQFQIAAARVDLAENVIQAASASQEAARLAALDAAAGEKNRREAVRLQKLADERQQSELAAQKVVAENERLQAVANTSNNQFRQPRVKDPQYRLGGDSIVTVSIQNATGYSVCVTFSSYSQRHIWPAQGQAFVAEPGQTITIRLAGTPHEELFYRAWAAQNPNLQWASCDCGPDGRLTPIAVFGQSDDSNPQLLTLVQN